MRAECWRCRRVTSKSDHRSLCPARWNLDQLLECAGLGCRATSWLQCKGQSTACGSTHAPTHLALAPPTLLCSCSYVRRLRGLASGVVHRLRRPPASCVGPPLARVTSQQKFNREITILSEKLRNDVCHRCRTRFSSFFVLCLRATRHLYLPSMRDDLWLEYPIPPLPDFTCPRQVSKA